MKQQNHHDFATKKTDTNHLAHPFFWIKLLQPARPKAHVTTSTIGLNHMSPGWTWSRLVADWTSNRLVLHQLPWCTSHGQLQSWIFEVFFWDTNFSHAKVGVTQWDNNMNSVWWYKHAKIKDVWKRLTKKHLGLVKVVGLWPWIAMPSQIRSMYSQINNDSIRQYRSKPVLNPNTVLNPAMLHKFPNNLYMFVVFVSINNLCQVCITFHASLPLSKIIAPGKDRWLATPIGLSYPRYPNQPEWRATAPSIQTHHSVIKWIVNSNFHGCYQQTA